MYVIVQHRIKVPETALLRGQRLISGDGAPQAVNVLQFYPSQDKSLVTCLWESDSVESVQAWVDTTLGDASDNVCYEVDTEQAFSERALGLSAKPMVSA